MVLGDGAFGRLLDHKEGTLLNEIREREVAQSCPTLCDPKTAAYQAPPSMGFSRQEYWSGVPVPSPLNEISSLRNPELPSAFHHMRIQ